jgi:hypothetical protein
MVPAHEGVPGNEKADEWTKLEWEEPDAHGVEWLGRTNEYRRRPMPTPRSLANIAREISEEKWAEASQWSKGRITAKKYDTDWQRNSDRTGWWQGS